MGNFLAEHFDMIGYCRDKRKLNRETIMEDQLKRHSEQLKEYIQKHYDERKALLPKVHYLRITGPNQVEVACRPPINEPADEGDQGATFHAFYHVPQGECCMQCTIEWQKSPEHSQ